MAAVALLGAAISAIGSIASGMAQATNMSNQAEAMRYNAEVSRQNAAIANQQANAREEATRRKTSKIQGVQRAAIAQSGLGLSDSLQNIYSDSAINAELDALNSRYEGYMISRGYKNQAALQEMQAQVYDDNASNALFGAGIGAVSSLLSGFSRFTRSSYLYGAGDIY